MQIRAHQTCGNRRGIDRLAAIAVMALLSTMQISAANAAIASIYNPDFIAIPASGTDSGPAAPSPSTIAVSGIAGPVTSVTVDIFGFTHDSPADIDMLLAGPAGKSVMLMSDVGGDLPIGLTFLTFDDNAAGEISATESLGTGTFKPTNSSLFDVGDDFPASAASGSFTTLLSTFNGLDPNGSWQLWVNDDGAGGNGAIDFGWRLNLQTRAVPLPASLLLMGAALAGLGLVGRRKRLAR